MVTGDENFSLYASEIAELKDERDEAKERLDVAMAALRRIRSHPTRSGFGDDEVIIEYDGFDACSEASAALASLDEPMEKCVNQACPLFNMVVMDCTTEARECECRKEESVRGVERPLGECPWPDSPKPDDGGE